MDELTYLEDQARRNAAFSLENMDRLCQRAQSLLTLLLGGAGGAGAYALAQLGKPDAVWAVASLGALSLWWFVLAGWVATVLLTPKAVRPPAADGWDSLNFLHTTLAPWAQAQGQPVENNLAHLREQDLKHLHDTAAEYRGINGSMARHIKGINYCAAGSPVIAILALLAVARWA